MRLVDVPPICSSFFHSKRSNLEQQRVKAAFDCEAHRMFTLFPACMVAVTTMTVEAAKIKQAGRYGLERGKRLEVERGRLPLATQETRPQEVETTSGTREY
jgi:hypothetical protein